jgi:hypothetical protein
MVPECSGDMDVLPRMPLCALDSGLADGPAEEEAAGEEMRLMGDGTRARARLPSAAAPFGCCHDEASTTLWLVLADEPVEMGSNRPRSGGGLPAALAALLAVSTRARGRGRGGMADRGGVRGSCSGERSEMMW